MKKRAHALPKESELKGVERLKSGLFGDQDLMYPWRKYFEASQRIKESLDNALRLETGCDLPEFSFFLALSEAPDHTLRVTDLVNHMAFTFSRLNYRINKLIDAGLIEKRTCTDDRRAHTVTMTPAGVEHFVVLAKAHERHLTKLFGTTFGAQELQAVQDMCEAFDVEAVNRSVRPFG